jgi:hypothetical protein
VTSEPLRDVGSIPIRRTIAFLRERGWRCSDAEGDVGYFEPVDKSIYPTFDYLADEACSVAHEIQATIAGMRAWHEEEDEGDGDWWVWIIVRPIRY